MSLSSNLRGSANYVWSVNAPLGQGATGAVHLCRHKRTGEQYAVKTFNAVSHYRPYEVQSREFEVMRKLNHKNVVQMVAIEEEQHSRTKIIVMELCECSLYNLLDKPENAYGMEEKESLKVLYDVAEGMQYLHRQNVVHRDIKPGNIMRCIGEDGESIYKLTDFGAARELEESEQFMSLYGTEEYLYPDMYERAVLRRPVHQPFGKEVDMWSLGVTLFHTFTGLLPFRPFGGRRNKEIMHKITAEKDVGVISGVQHTEGGPIEYSKELPNTCRLSKGLQLLVIPLLAGLMEINSTLMWTFEQYISTCKAIASKGVIYVFSTCTCESLSIYIETHETYAKFQELVAEQTEIRASEQLVIFQNMPLSKIVQPLTPAGNYPKTQPAEPFLLFYTSVEDALFQRLTELTIPRYPKFGTSISLDNDYPLAKQCASVTYHIYYNMEDIYMKQNLYDHSVTTYIQIVKNEIAAFQESTTFIVVMITETHKRLQTIVKSFGFALKVVLMMLERRKEQIPNEFRFMEEDVKSAVVELTDSCQEMMKSMEELKNYVQQFYRGVVTDGELSKKWKSSWGCSESDRCVEKVKVLLRNIVKTMDDFKKDKQLKRLPYNDEQIHKFEKNRMNENCTKANSLLHDHCFPNLKRVYKKYEDTFMFVGKFMGKLMKVQKRIMNLTEKQSRISTALDEKAEQCLRKMQSVMTTLETSEECVGRGKATASPLLGTEATRVSSSGQTEQNVTRIEGSNKQAASEAQTARTKALMKEIAEGVRSLGLDSAELKVVVQENSDLIQSLRSFQLKNGHVENGVDDSISAGQISVILEG